MITFTGLLQGDFINLLVSAHGPGHWVPLLRPRAPAHPHRIWGTRATNSALSEDCCVVPYQPLPRAPLVLADDWAFAPFWSWMTTRGLCGEPSGSSPSLLRNYMRILGAYPSLDTKWVLHPWWVYDLFPRKGFSFFFGLEEALSAF